MRTGWIIRLRDHTIEQQKRLLGKKRKSTEEPTSTKLALNNILRTRIGEQADRQETVLVGNQDLLGPQPPLHLLEAVRMDEIGALDAAAIHEQGLLDRGKLVVDERVERGRAALEAGLRERGWQWHESSRRLARSLVQLQMLLVRLGLQQDVLQCQTR